mgnify:CR=1 FL=1
MVVENLGSSLGLNFASVKSVKSLKESFRKVTTKHPEKFYPVNVLKTNGFVRKQCKVCGRFFWTTNPNEEVCGDATCRNGYSFINNTPAKAKLSYKRASPQRKSIGLGLNPFCVKDSLRVMGH